MIKGDIIKNGFDRKRIKQLAKQYNWLLIALSLFLMSYSVKFFFTSHANLASIASGLSNQIHHKEWLIKKTVEDSSFLRFLKQSDTALFQKKEAAQFIEQFNYEGITLLIYRQNTLVFWTGNTVTPKTLSGKKAKGTSFVQLSNGSYLQMVEERNGAEIIALLPVKWSYVIKNNYLTPSFNSILTIPDYVAITDSSSWSAPVKSAAGTYLFSIDYTDETTPVLLPFVQNLCWIFAILIIFFKVDQTSQSWVNKGALTKAFALLIGTIVGFRLLGLVYKFPASIYEDWELFNPTVFAASFWLPSLGDFVIDGCLGLWLVYFTRRNLVNFPLPEINKRGIYYAFTAGFVLFIYILADVLSSIFGSLIINSNIPFDVSNILSFNGYSLVGFIMLGVCLYIFFLLCVGFVSYIQRFQFTREEKLVVFAFSLLIGFIYKVGADTLDLLMISNAVFLFALDWFISNKIRLSSLAASASILLIFSVVSSTKLQGFNQQKDIENRKLLALELESGNDPVTEFLFTETSERLANDSILLKSFNTDVGDNEGLNERLRQLYFGNYFNKYVITFSRYAVNKEPLDPKYTPLYELQKTIDESGIATTTTGLYQIGNAKGLQYYLAKIIIRKNYVAIGTLIVKLQSKQFESNNKYPELLLAENLSTNKGLTDYSYAFYQSGKLLNEEGEYSYSLSDKSFYTKGTGFTMQQDDGYDHLIYNPDFTKKIVLSKAMPKVFNSIALFTYFFAFLSIFLFFVYVFRSSYKFVRRQLIPQGFEAFRVLVRENSLLFKMRIQVSIVVTVVASLLVVGLITLAYITDRYNTEQYNRLNQKIKSVQIACENKNYSSDMIGSREQVYLDIINLSRLFNTDISIYDTDGQLLVSTQPGVFDQGLLAPQMNPLAYYNVSGLAKSTFITREQIGRLNYLSAYAPLNADDGRTIAYVSLPYFTNQNEYQEEVSYFANALINVYTLVFTLIGFVAFFVANAITSPLTIIQQTLSKTKIGQVNEPIVWSRNDEIGSLVQEYNRMISELEASAEKLGQSERESAWREMAKQVAHEIKNPLTPLKLGLQQLERSWKDKDPDFDKKFAKFAQTFMQQIDSLSEIATEFSSFAKMSQERNEPVDVLAELTKVVDLFKHTEHVNIQFRSENGINTWILADVNQINRSFNNLVKNAIQAIPKEREGQVDIKIWADAKNLHIQITDNGTGIPEAIQEKIFVPNFTTKNSGMGLGLAIIKNVIDSVGGSIRFETKFGEGTSFFVTFPLYQEP